MSLPFSSYMVYISVILLLIESTKQSNNKKLLPFLTTKIPYKPCNAQQAQSTKNPTNPNLEWRERERACWRKRGETQCRRGWSHQRWSFKLDLWPSWGLLLGSMGTKVLIREYRNRLNGCEMCCNSCVLCL